MYIQQGTGVCKKTKYFSNFSDFKTCEGNFNRPDLVKAGAANENGVNALSDSYKHSTDINGKFSKEYEDNAINAKWEKEKEQESQSDAPGQCE